MTDTTISFDAALFRAQCPAYRDSTVYPDSVLNGMWDLGTNFVSNLNAGYLQGAGRAAALNYMTAHLVFLNDLILAGTNPGNVTSSGVDRTNVTLEAPKQASQWKYWLNQSPYGKALLALLRINAVGGFYAGGGSQPRSGIRQPNGGFLPYAGC